MALSALRLKKLRKQILLKARMLHFNTSAVPSFVGGVYRIRNVKTRQCYIGATKNLRARMSTHRHLLTLEAHTDSLQAAFTKYGPEAFRFEVLLICAPEHLAMFELGCLLKFKPAYNYYKEGNSGRPRRTLCEGCDGELTSADREGGQCSQCGRALP